MSDSEKGHKGLILIIVGIIILGAIVWVCTPKYFRIVGADAVVITAERYEELIEAEYFREKHSVTFTQILEQETTPPKPRQIPFYIVGDDVFSFEVLTIQQYIGYATSIETKYTNHTGYEIPSFDATITCTVKDRHGKEVGYAKIQNLDAIEPWASVYETFTPSALIDTIYEIVFYVKVKGFE